jgi:transposase
MVTLLMSLLPPRSQSRNCKSDTSRRGREDHEREHPSRWAAISSIAGKIGCTAQTLHEWVKKAEVDSGTRAGVPSEVAERLKALERENRELRQANEILRKASAYFAQAELDRRFKP